MSHGSHRDRSLRGLNMIISPDIDLRVLRMVSSYAEEDHTLFECDVANLVSWTRSRKTATLSTTRWCLRTVRILGRTNPLELTLLPDEPVLHDLVVLNNYYDGLSHWQTDGYCKETEWVYLITHHGQGPAEYSKMSTANYAHLRSPSF